LTLFYKYIKIQKKFTKQRNQIEIPLSLQVRYFIMNDNKILALYNNRDESAITETSAKYGGYCTAIAMNILQNKQDADECVNDTWLKAWEAIPKMPEPPKILSSYLGRITRNLSLNLYNAGRAEKRGGSDVTLLLEELGDCAGASHDTGEEFDSRETGKAISDFLRSIETEPRKIFVRRYWYSDPIGELATRFNMSESKIKSMLMRTRDKLKLHLQERGIYL
jgi:RNA polymerase sigma-70 factor (ECF subfamily)